MVIQACFSVFLLVTVAPLVTCATLVCLAPDRWGGHPSPLTIVAMAFFGFVSAPFLVTYLPILIITPLIMGYVSKSRFFRAASTPVLVAIFLILGCIVGVLVTGRIALMVLNDNEPSMAMDWAIAGAMAGACTAPMIAMCYKKLGVKSEPTFSKNGSNDK